jgi:hypothetical protein
MAQQPVLVVNEHHMMQLGVEYGGFRLSSIEADKVRFRELFGIDPKGASLCFRDLQLLNAGGEAAIKKFDPFYFLMTLYWMHGYGTEARVCGTFHVNSTKTFRDHAWAYLAAIQALSAQKVSKMIN